MHADDPWLRSLKFVPVFRTDEETIALFCDRGGVMIPAEKRKAGGCPRDEDGACLHWMGSAGKCAWVEYRGRDGSGISDRVVAPGEDRGAGKG